MRAKSGSLLFLMCWLGSCVAVEEVRLDAPSGVSARPAIAALTGPGLQAPDQQDPEQQDPEQQDPSLVGAQPFQPEIPVQVDADWIQLVSGEWLKGEFEVLRDGTVEFDSDELDDLVLDWDDIIQVRLAGRHTVLLEDGASYTGLLSMKDGVVVLTGDTEQRVDRDRLMSVVPEFASESDFWSGKLSLGTTFRRGNTEQVDYSSYGFLRRETLATRWDTSYNGAFSRVQDVETANNHRARSRFDWFLSNRFYVTVAGFDVFRDPFQNVKVRVTPYAAVGYDVISEGKVDWSLSAGPAYQQTKFESVSAGEEDTDGTAAVILSSRFGWDITPDVELDFDYDITVPLPESQNYNHHLAVVLAIDLVEDFDLDLSLIWDRVNSPSPDVNGDTPDQDDLRLTVGIGYEF